ncbi:MAG: MFS transporter [Clostridiaceae bacterium]|nr:MFS transporter [Clostridiaceae bacterium]
MNARKRNITIALMVAMFLGAVEGTVVTNAVPTIVRDLKGFELISWVFSLYLLTSAVSTPIYGKLADLYGRKNILSIGIVIFLIGSCLCGLSQNMYQLIAFRTLQGLGAGSIFTITYTIVGDVFTFEERAKIQGWLSTVWGVASLMGPFLGGFLIDNLSWHWIFFINLPFGILSVILLEKYLKEDFEKKKPRIDYLGTIVLSISIVILLYGFLTGEKSKLGYTNTVILCMLISFSLFLLFYFIEKRVIEPIIPFEVFTRTSTIVNIISFFTAATLIAMDVYIPIYVQNVLGYSATISGFSMAPMSITWLLSSFILAKSIPRYGEKVVVAISTLILLASCLLLPTLGINSPLLLVIIYACIMGFGFGGCFTTLTIVVQSSVDFTKRGVATSTNALVRTLGQTIAVSVFGGVFNLSIVKYFSNIGIKGVEPNNLYSDMALNSGITPDNIKASLNSGLHTLFIMLILIIIICVGLSLTLSSSLKNKKAIKKEFV